MASCFSEGEDGEIFLDGSLGSFSGFYYCQRIPKNAFSHSLLDNVYILCILILQGLFTSFLYFSPALFLVTKLPSARVYPIKSAKLHCKYDILLLAC